MKIMPLLTWIAIAVTSSFVASCIKPPQKPDTKKDTFNDFHDTNSKQLKFNLRPCEPSDPKVDGGWGAWGACERWSQKRACDNPSPQCGGKNCEGSDTQRCISHDVPSWCFDKDGRPSPPRKPTQEDVKKCWDENPDIPKECIRSLLEAASDDPAQQGKYPDFDGKCGCKMSHPDTETDTQKGRPLYSCTSPTGLNFNISPLKISGLAIAGVMIPPTDGKPNYCMFDVSLGGDPWIGDRMEENCFGCHDPEDPENSRDPKGCPPAIDSEVLKTLLAPTKPRP